MIKVSEGFEPRSRSSKMILLSGLLLLPLVLGGCDSDDDCVTCLDTAPPVVPTGVHSISEDNNVVVRWHDISYSPYDGTYSPNVVAYIIYSRYFTPGDENDPNRQFYVIGEVAWDENFEWAPELDAWVHYFNDWDAVNGERYEYAVSAVNEAGVESALSFEFVIDAPLPMDTSGVILFGSDDPTDPNSSESGFDFSDLQSVAVDPWAAGSLYDIRIFHQSDVPHVQSAANGVRIQDAGMFVDGGALVFEGVSEAPDDFYSETGTLELVLGHIYVVEIQRPELHYAKFGITQRGTNWVEIVWAYQTIPGLPELKVPDEPAPGSGARLISL